MVELIGIVTIVAMNWVLAATMANESESQLRRRGRHGFEDDERFRAGLSNPLSARDAA